MFALLKRSFMFVVFVTSIIAEIFLFNFYLSLRKTNPNLEVDTLKFIGCALGMAMLVYFTYYSFKHVVAIFQAQSSVEKDQFAFQKQFQLKSTELDLQRKLKEQYHQQQIRELQQQIELNKQILLETQNKKGRTKNGK